ncbi:MED6-domain-containing protein [Serendipita vermifera]|nr:MED6-domain-containing protein [Serendipita vermifera]
MATDSEFYPKDDHSWKAWMFQEYLQVRGPLTEENVMEYFEESFLFDRSSNNNVLRMQTQHADPNYRMSRPEMENELKRFTGKEYALVHAQPPLFVIQQRDRLSPTEVRPTAVYFILNNVLYSAPDLYTLLSTKLTNALSMIQSSLDTLRAARPDYTPRVGHVWPIVEAPSTSKILSKPPGGTRQNSVAPGTPVDPSQQSKSQQQQQPPDSSVKPPQDNEEKQVWEPFAFAFQATRIEMERKRQAAAAAALANSVGGGPAGGPSGSSLSAEGMGQVGTE